jgi:hypothetical protein
MSARDPETFEPIRTGTWENADWDKLMNRALARLGGEATPPNDKSQPKPQPQPTPPQPPATKNNNPEHNALIKTIRRHTGHSSDQIVSWCLSHNASSPAELTPELCHQLAEALALGWGQSKFQTPELCENAYRGKIRTLMAAGQHWGNAIASWIEGVQGEVVAQH